MYSIVVIRTTLEQKTCIAWIQRNIFMSVISTIWVSTKFKWKLCKENARVYQTLLLAIKLKVWNK